MKRVGTAWLVVQPLYGFLSDGFPILGYRRRSYMALAGVLGALSWFALSSSAVVDTATKVPGNKAGRQAGRGGVGG